MKIALIITTINVPTVLQLYRKLDSTVHFFVAADEKTPLEAYQFCADIPDCEIYSPDRQNKLGYECSSLLGWSTVTRRNIALLEALKWGAEIVVTIDDDNMAMDDPYFWYFQKLLDNQWPWVGLQIGSSLCWFDPGSLQFSRDNRTVTQRGFPQRYPMHPIVKPIIGARIGVAQGMILGDPDTSAIDRISQQPEVHQVSELLRAGSVVNLNTWTVFNTQNTAFLRELAPAMFCNPHFGRYDDIYASLMTQRIMRERGLHVHLGQPFVWQQRNDHDLLKDLAAEQWGAEHILEFADYLKRSPLPASISVVEQCIILTNGCALFSDDAKEVAEAWYRDCERVL